MNIRRTKVLPQFVEVRLSGLAHQSEGPPSTEQAALALRIAPEDHEELMRCCA